MSDFEPAIEVVLSHEGGLSTRIDDHGGVTNFGISKAAFPDVDVANLTVEKAKTLYLLHFWDPFHFGWIESQRIATKVFDLGVNIGPAKAVRILQQALATFVSGTVIADGVLGMQTVLACREVPEEKLVAELKARAAMYHAELNQPQFLLGWLRRDVDG